MTSFSAGAALLTLHSPQPGQQDSQYSDVKIRVSMDNTIRTYRLATDNSEAISLRFREPMSKLSEALTFFKQQQGNYFIYTDEDTDQWDCFLPEKELSITVSERGARCADNDYGFLDIDLRRWPHV